MARSRGFHPRSRTSNRRRTSWGVGPGGQTSQTVSATTSIIVGSGVTPGATAPLTIVRLRGLLHIMQTAATNLGDGFVGAFGCGVASENAFTAGIASLPTPLTDSEWEGWLYHEHFSVRSANIRAAVDNIIGDANMTVKSPVDSKAMRILSDEMIFYAALETVIIGAATIRVTFDSRALYKLP